MALIVFIKMALLQVAKTLKFLNKIPKVSEKEALGVGEINDRLLEFGRTLEVVSIQPGISDKCILFQSISVCHSIAVWAWQPS